MPVRPWPRCINPNCPLKGKPFQRTNAKGRTPDFCSPECRADFRASTSESWRYCGRPGCRKIFQQAHSSDKFCCEGHKWGCRWCGGDLLPRRNTDLLPDSYCSRDCRQKAWEGVPLPKCFFCGKPVELPEGGRSRKDPPKAHRRCYQEHNTPKTEKAQTRPKKEKVTDWRDYVPDRGIK